MSNPTSSFGWQMPTAVDLVTDLPADFEVFGQAVDSSMADLLGGTTGQILAKNSATNMDFVWVANDQGDITGVTAGTGITVADPTGPVPTVTNAMATAIDAKGDLIVGTGADTFSRLAVGATNGHVLTVDSSAATGLKYAATAGGGKVLQVVSATTTTSTSIASLTMTDTTITATITPTLNTSKILVLISVQVKGICTAGETVVAARMMRGATAIQEYGPGGLARFLRIPAVQDFTGIFSLTYLDSPATTSATTYKLQSAVERTADSMTAIYQGSSTPSTITLLEIGA